MVKSHLQNQHETTPHFPKTSGNGLIACLDWWFSILGISSTKGIVTLGYPQNPKPPTPPKDSLPL